MMPLTVSHETWIAAMAALRECESLYAHAPLAAERWKSARRELRTAGIATIVHQIECDNLPATKAEPPVEDAPNDPPLLF